MAMLLPVNSGHTSVIRNRAVPVYPPYADERTEFNPTDPKQGLVDFNAPFSAATVGEGAVNVNQAQPALPEGNLFVAGSIVLQSPVGVVPGDWTEIFVGVDPSSGEAPTGEFPYYSFINSTYIEVVPEDSYLIGACFQNGQLYLLRWDIVPPTYQGSSLLTPARAVPSLLAQMTPPNPTMPDKVGHVWVQDGTTLWFSTVLQGDLYSWNGTSLVHDGNVGVGADICILSADVVICGPNFVKLRTGAGVYEDILHTGTLTPPELTIVGGLGYHAYGEFDEFGGFDTVNQVFIPQCTVHTGDDLLVGGSVYDNNSLTTLYSVIITVRFVPSEAAIIAYPAALRGGTDQAPGVQRMMPYGFGVQGIGEITYPFDDASLDDPITTNVSGTSAALLQTVIQGVGTSFLSDFEVGDFLDLSGTPNNFRVVLEVISDTQVRVSGAIGNGSPSQTIRRKRLQPVSTSGPKIFFLDVGGIKQGTEATFSPPLPGVGFAHLGMYDPVSDRWYWNRMIATYTFGTDPISYADWAFGSMTPYEGDLVYTMKAKDPNNQQYYLLNRVSMQKHLPVDTLTTGFERDYIYPPPGDLPPLYNGGYYQFYQPHSTSNLNSHCSPAVGGWDRFLALAANLGRNIIVLNDDGSIQT